VLRTITRRRPTASEREPQTGETTAMERTTMEIESPAVAGLTSNRAERIGRIGWVI